MPGHREVRPVILPSGRLIRNGAGPWARTVNGTQGDELKLSQIEDIGRWESEATPTLLRLIATLHAAAAAARSGPGPLLSATDQLSSAWAEAQERMSTNPSPSSALNDRLRSTLRTVRIVARSFETGFTDSHGSMLDVIDREVESLVGTIANTFAVFSDDHQR